MGVCELGLMTWLQICSSFHYNEDSASNSTDTSTRLPYRYRHVDRHRAPHKQTCKGVERIEPAESLECLRVLILWMRVAWQEIATRSPAEKLEKPRGKQATRNRVNPSSRSHQSRGYPECYSMIHTLSYMQWAAWPGNSSCERKSTISH